MAESVSYGIVPDWPAYRVGTDGSLWSRWRKGARKSEKNRFFKDKWKIMHPGLDDDGYRNALLISEDGRHVHRKVGAIVLRTFVGPPKDDQECRHLDGVSTNDQLSNLCWGTSLENHADRRIHGTIPSGATHLKTRLTKTQLAVLMALKGKVAQQVAASRFGVSRSHVGRLWSGKRKQVHK